MLLNLWDFFLLFFFLVFFFPSFSDAEFPPRVSPIKRRIQAACFPSTLIPPCLYSSSIQLLLVSAQAHSVLYCSLMCVAIPQIYVAAEGWLPYFLRG